MDKGEEIAVVETDEFTIGFMGRTGGRSIMRHVAPEYAPFLKANAGKARPSLITGHAFAMRTFEYFNSKIDVPKILVLRDPVERAIAGSKTMLYPEYHGAPYLHNIDTDSIDYIIRFDRISEYVDFHRREDNIPYGTPPEMYKRYTKASLILARDNSPSIDVDYYIKDWNVEDYEYTGEINLYNNILNSKPELAPDIWREWCSKSIAHNFPRGTVIINDGFEL